MTLTLLQYNTHLFTGTAAALGYHTDYEDDRRRAAIISKIIQSPPDLVMLEEVWSSKSQRAFTSAGGTALPFHRTDGIDSPFEMGSGLVLLSRHELRVDPDPGRVKLPAFTVFNASHGADSWVQKGYLTVQVCPKGETPFWVIHTHTQSGSSNEDITARAAQFKQIAQTLALISHHFGQAAIVVGDLNVIGEAANAPTQEWSDVATCFSSAGLIDGFRTYHPDIAAAPGLTYDGSDNALIRFFAPEDAKAKQRLDYAWVPPKTVVAASVDRSFVYQDPASGTSMPLSDHFALRLTLDICAK